MELILLSAYCPDIKRQDLLRNSVRYLSSQNKDILLVSHSQVPQDIIDQCKFYFYDEENKFLPNDELKLWFVIELNHGIIRSRDPYQTSTSLIPVYRLVLYGLGIAKHLGYKYVHYLEYDNEITDIDFINNNTKILEEGYGNISYRYINELNQELIEGTYTAYNLDHYSFEDLQFNEDEIITKYRRNYPFVELMTRTEYLDPKNPYKKQQEDLQQEGLIPNLNYSGTRDGSYVCPIIYEDGTFFIYHHRQPNLGNEGEEEIEVIVDNFYVRVGTSKGLCRFIPTGKIIDDVKHFKVLKDNKVLFEYDLTQPLEKERLFENNKFIRK